MSMLASGDAETDGGDDNGGLLKRPCGADVADAAEQGPEKEVRGKSRAGCAEVTRRSVYER